MRPHHAVVCTLLLAIPGAQGLGIDELSSSVAGAGRMPPPEDPMDAPAPPSCDRTASRLDPAGPRGATATTCGTVVGTCTVAPSRGPAGILQRTGPAHTWLSWRPGPDHNVTCEGTVELRAHLAGGQGPVDALAAVDGATAVCTYIAPLQSCRTALRTPWRLEWPGVPGTPAGLHACLAVHLAWQDALATASSERWTCDFADQVIFTP